MKHIKSTWTTITALALGLFLPISAVVGAPVRTARHKRSPQVKQRDRAASDRS